MVANFVNLAFQCRCIVEVCAEPPKSREAFLLRRSAGYLKILINQVVKWDEMRIILSVRTVPEMRPKLGECLSDGEEEGLGKQEDRQSNQI